MSPPEAIVCSSTIQLLVACSMFLYVGRSQNMVHPIHALLDMCYKLHRPVLSTPVMVYAVKVRQQYRCVHYCYQHVTACRTLPLTFHTHDWQCADLNGCQSNPCDGIPSAVVGSCEDRVAPALDFSCNCSSGWVWNQTDLLCKSEPSTAHMCLFFWHCTKCLCLCQHIAMASTFHHHVNRAALIGYLQTWMLALAAPAMPLPTLQVARAWTCRRHILATPAAAAQATSGISSTAPA
jgi:hypothetical protein